MKLKKLFLIIEFALLFVGLPLIFYLDVLPLPKIPSLMAFTGFCLVILLRDPSFERTKLWNYRAQRYYLKTIGVRLVIVTLFLLAVTVIFHPALFFFFPKNKPLIWLIVMVLYPIFSAYPQELIYRTFLFHRYRSLLRSPSLIFTVSVIAFSFLHIIYDNGVAVLFALAGGYLFTRTYNKTESLAIATIEHALYGCCVFTVGLGFYFYEGF